MDFIFSSSGFLGAVIFCAFESEAEEYEVQQKYINSMKARRTMLAAFHVSE